jgi:hypothetical protein
MGQDPSDIRAEIEATRARVGEEVDALSYKTDVPARVGDYVDGKKQAVSGRVADVKHAIGDATSTVLPDGRTVGRLKDTAERNPIGLGLAGMAAGFLAGLMLPSTRMEDEKLGPLSDGLSESARKTAGDAVDAGRQVLEEAAGTAVESAKEHGQDLASNLQERAQESLSSSESPSGLASPR